MDAKLTISIWFGIGLFVGCLIGATVQERKDKKMPPFSPARSSQSTTAWMLSFSNNDTVVDNRQTRGPWETNHSLYDPDPSFFMNYVDWHNRFAVGVMQSFGLSSDMVTNSWVSENGREVKIYTKDGATFTWVDDRKP